LNKNNLTNKTGLKIAKLLTNQKIKIKELGLSWNKINSKSGNEIATAL